MVLLKEFTVPGRLPLCSIEGGGGEGERVLSSPLGCESELEDSPKPEAADLFPDRPPRLLFLRVTEAVGEDGSSRASIDNFGKEIGFLLSGDIGAADFFQLSLTRSLSCTLIVALDERPDDGRRGAGVA